MKWPVGLMMAALMAAGPLTLGAVAANIGIDAVPPAVRATIERETKGKVIKDIEKETKNGKTVYEVEWIDGHRKVEIYIDTDGKVMPR